MTTLRRTVHYSGQVQGVGFRYATHEVSRRFNVAGYVRNLPDGRVELVAEAEPDELARFVDAVDHTMGSYINDAVVTDGEATGDFSDFDIRS